MTTNGVDKPADFVFDGRIVAYCERVLTSPRTFRRSIWVANVARLEATDVWLLISWLATAYAWMQEEP